MFVENEKELGKALKDGKEKIEIKGDLAKRMKKIYELDQVLWGICFVCLTVTVAVFLTMPATAGVSSAISLAAGTPGGCCCRITHGSDRCPDSRCRRRDPYIEMDEKKIHHGAVG